jgi:hypothetical protein
MRKIWVVALGLALSGAALAGPPAADTLTDTSKKIIPQQGISSAPAWTADTSYAQGEIVRNAGHFYMAVNSGASTNAGPTHALATPSDVAYDGITWRVFDPKKRDGLLVVNTGTNTLSVSLGSPAVAGAGAVLAPAADAGSGGGSLIIDKSYQGAVYVVVGSGLTGSCGSQTWRE